MVLELSQSSADGVNFRLPGVTQRLGQLEPATACVPVVHPAALANWAVAHMLVQVLESLSTRVTGSENGACSGRL